MLHTGPGNHVRKDARLERLHGGGLGILLVIEAEQMQRAVHQHVRPVGGNRLALLRCLVATTLAQTTISPSKAKGVSAGSPATWPAGNDSTFVALSWSRYSRFNAWISVGIDDAHRDLDASRR